MLYLGRRLKPRERGQCLRKAWGLLPIHPDDLVIKHVPLDPFTCSRHAKCAEQVHAGATAWHQLTNVSTAE